MIKRFLFPAACAFALQFTLSCTTEDKEEGNVAKYTCQLSDGSCIPTVTASDCSKAGGLVVDAEVCEAQPSSSDSWGKRSSSSVGKSSSSDNGDWSSSSSSVLRSSSSSVARSSSSAPVTSNCSLNGETVTIGDQVWMAENLNCNVSGSKCYKDDPANCAKYGRLYDWETAMKVCPFGWHLPSKAEWDALTSYIESDNVCSYCDAWHLKSTSGWKSGWNYDGNGEDTYGFSALPGGYGDSVGDFDDVGDGGFWWSASEYDSYGAYVRNMRYYGEYANRNNGGKNFLFSVRCLQD